MPIHTAEFQKFEDVKRALKAIKMLTKEHGLLNSSVDMEEFPSHTFRKYSKRYRLVREGDKFVYRRPYKDIVEEKYYIKWSYDIDPKRQPTGKPIKSLKFKYQENKF